MNLNDIEVRNGESYPKIDNAEEVFEEIINCHGWRY